MRFRGCSSGSCAFQKCDVLQTGKFALVLGLAKNKDVFDYFVNNFVSFLVSEDGGGDYDVYGKFTTTEEGATFAVQYIGTNDGVRVALDLHRHSSFASNHCPTSSKTRKIFSLKAGWKT